MSDSSPGPIDPARLRRLVRPAQWAVSVVLVFAVLGFAVAPPVARHYAVKILSETLGRQVSIEGMSFNPFTLVAEVRGARVMAADGTTPGLAFDRLRANVELESVVRGGPVLHELSLAGLQLKLVRMAEGQHNWSDVAERLAAQPASDEALQFSVGNIQFGDARISIDDQVEGLQHELSAINFGIPFISNLPVKVDVYVEPSLSAQINGQPLVLGGRSKPFSANRETVLDLSLKDFELAPWLPYLPFEPAFKLKSGRLGTDLELGFSQPVDLPPTVALKGQVRVDALVVHDKADNRVVSIGELELELADVQPFVNRFHFSKLRLVQPEIDLVRLADGGINLQQLLPQQKPVKQDAAKKSKPPAAGRKGAAPGETAPPAEAKTKANELDFLLASARVRDGVIRFDDRTVTGVFRTRIEAINLDLRDLSNTGDLPAEIRLDYATDGGEKFSHLDSLRLVPFELSGSLTLEQLQPARYARYVALAMPDAEIRGGHIDGSIRYNLKLDGGALAAVIDAEILTLNDFELALKGSKSSAVKVPQMVVSNAHLALAERTVKVGSVEVKAPSVAAIRQRDGQIDLLALGGARPAETGRGGAESAPWSVTVDKLALDDASVRVEDRSAGKPVVLEADGITLKIDNFSTAKGAALTLALESRINKRGKLGATGTAVLDPLKTSLKLDLQSVDLLPLQPYVLEQTRIAISRGNLSSKGTLVLEAAADGELKGQFKGDVGVANFASVDRQSATDFVRWRGLNIRGVDLKLAPFALDVRDIALNDFYTRLILSEEGKLNLREIQPGAEAAEAAAAEKEKAEAALAGGGQQNKPMPRIRIGRIDLKGGNIAFSDRFIRPNYDANLTGMTGELTGLSSDPTTIAKLGLVGKVDNAAPVAINGEFNPFRQDQYLNIGASVKDFELTSLSSYSGKYVGYGIQKGKLSAEVTYRIEDRKLSASNRIFLDQLTFGDAVDSPDAVNLPVQLAVSLLKNGRGEIDLDLPVSGTMDDPEFSVFGLVVRALFNLVGKAITSPFALLGAAFGGGEELSKLEFEAGATRIGAAQEEQLTLLAKALNDRPGLRLEVTGIADPAVDLAGIKRAKLLDQVRAVKLKAMIKRGESAPSLSEIELSEQEYPELLAEVYAAADIKKPRNLIGFAKRLPVPETEAMLLAIIEVGEEDYKTLALQRAQGVRHWLVETGKVPPDRVFLAAPSGEQASAGGPLVHFALR